VLELDLEELAAIVELLSGAEFTEFRLQKGDFSLVVTRGCAVSALPATVPAPAATSASQSAASAQPAPPARNASRSDRAAAPHGAPPAGLEDGEVLITTPMLGTFYRSPKPGERPFVEVGDKIDAEAVVGIVEVMKLMSSIPAGVTGEITRVLAHDGQLVEADQPLFAVRATE
jgi:acetyl-CoA carboxylase biotin carboxyl carrier protein